MSIAAVSLAFTVGSTVLGFAQQKKADKLAKKKMAIQSEMDLENKRREELRLQRESRAKRAQILNGSAQTGLQYSSSASGASQAVESSTTRDINYVEKGIALQQQSDSISRAQMSNDFNAQTVKLIGSGINSIGDPEKALRGITDTASKIFS